MNKAQALYAFWSSFGLPALDEQSAYDSGSIESLGMDYPFITYESATSDFDSTLALGCDLWYKSTSWTAIEEKAQEILNEIGLGGVIVNYDGGAIWITRGSASRTATESGYDIRRIHINVDVEFLSE